MTHSAHIIIVGAGPAGLEAASILGTTGYKVTVFEKEDQTGGKLPLWYKLFPGFRNSVEGQTYFASGYKVNPPVIITNAEVVNIIPEEGRYTVIIADGQTHIADAVLIATGYQTFDAHNADNFLAGADAHFAQNDSSAPGIFSTGICTEPLSVAETLSEARSTTAKIIAWLRTQEMQLKHDEMISDTQIS